MTAPPEKLELPQKHNQAPPSRSGELFEVDDEVYVTKCMTVGTDGSLYVWAEPLHSRRDTIAVFREDEIRRIPF